MEAGAGTAVSGGDSATGGDCLRARLSTLRRGLEVAALGRLGNVALAADAAQEVVLRLLTAVDSGVALTEAQLGPYAYGILRHVLSDMQRQARRELALGTEHERAFGSTDPLERMVSAESGRQVRAALRQLPVAERRLIELCFVEGARVCDIARQTGEPEVRLRVRKLRALARLRGLLGNEWCPWPKE